LGRPGTACPTQAAATKIGYEISFTRYFYKPQPLRTLDEIRADILALEKETEGLLSEIVKGGKE
jgi:type I restriction enzyme M protein